MEYDWFIASLLDDSICVDKTAPVAEGAAVQVRSQGGMLPFPLAVGVTYFLFEQGGAWFLAISRATAFDGDPINMTSTGTGLLKMRFV